MRGRNIGDLQWLFGCSMSEMQTVKYTLCYSFQLYVSPYCCNVRHLSVNVCTVKSPLCLFQIPYQ